MAVEEQLQEGERPIVGIPECKTQRSISDISDVILNMFVSHVNPFLANLSCFESDWRHFFFFTTTTVIAETENSKNTENSKDTNENERRVRPGLNDYVGSGYG